MGAEMTWQPIETAPKDGTKILGYDDGDILVMVFETDQDGAGGWYIELSERAYTDVPEWTPTHWMPLPEPPK